MEPEPQTSEDEPVESEKRGQIEPQPAVGAGAGSAGRAHAESTGAETSGPTGGAEPYVQYGSGEPEPIDLLEAAGSSFARRVVPLVIASILGAALAAWVIRRRRR